MVETVKDSDVRAAKRRQQRRELIIAAAEDQLVEAGVAGTTLAAVGERVGLSKGALYYYVDSRDDLLAMVLDDGLQAIRAEAAATADPDAAPIDRLTAFARAHVRCAIERPSGPLIVSNVDLLAAHDRTAELLHEHEEAARAIIRDATEDRTLRPIHPVIASSALFGALNTLCRTYDPDGELSLDTMIDGTLELLFRGWRT